MQKQPLHIEKLRKVTLLGILLIVFLIISLVVLLQTAYIQTKIAQYIARELSSELKTDIKISYAKISLFRGIVLKEFHVNDLQKDTLFYVKELTIVPSGLQTNFKNLSFNKIHLNNLYVNLYELKKDSTNLSFLLDYFKSDKKQSENEYFRLNIEQFELTDSKFKYHTSDSLIYTGFDPQNLNFENINIKIKNLLIKNEEISAHNLYVALTDINGFELKNLSTEFFEVNPESIKLKNIDLVTKESFIRFDSLNLFYPSQYNFKNYATHLYVDLSIKPSGKLSYTDIEYFLNDTSGIDESVSISGKINGCLDSLTVDYIDLKYKDIFFLNFKGYINKFYSSTNPSFNVEVIQFSTNIEKIKNLPFQEKENILSKIPKELENIKTLNYKGLTKGTFSKFESFGEISGNFGTITLNATAKKDSLTGMNINGIFTAKEIDLSEPTKDENFGELSFTQEVDLTISKKQGFKLISKGLIETLTYRQFPYRDIELYAEINNKKIDSVGISINQQEIKALLYGNIDLTQDIPEVNLIADIKKADLKKLNIEKKNKDSKLSFCLNMFFNGFNIDDFTGLIYLSKPLYYSRDTTNINIKHLELAGNMIRVNDTLSKMIELSSDVADISVLSNGKPSVVLNSFKSFITGLFQYRSDTISIFSDTITEGYLSIEGVIKHPKEIANLFYPELQIPGNASFSANFYPLKNKFNFSLNTPSVTYKSFTIKDFYAIAYTRENQLYAGIGGSSLKAFNPLYLENISFEGDFKNDSLNFNMSWNNYNDTSNYAGDINGSMGMINMNNMKSYIFRFSDSKLILKQNEWSFKQSTITFDSAKMTIGDFKFQNNEQEIYIDGNISKNPGDILYARFKNFNINNLIDLIPGNFDLGGRLYGSAIFAQLYENPLIFTKDSIIDLRINNIDFGNFYVSSNWDDPESKIHTNAYNLKGSKKKFMNDTIYGDYWPNKDSISLIADIRSMTLQAFKQYFEDYVEFNNTAYVTGKLNLFGDIKNPLYSANLKLKQTSFLIKYLNTTNTLIEPEIYIDNKLIKLYDTRIKSTNKNGYSDLYGSITHHNFSDLYMDINLRPENFVITDLYPSDSAYFWGKSIVSGNINISGPINNIFLDADITTEKNTKIYIPISSSESLSEENNFIRFIKDSIEQRKTGKGENYKFETGGFGMNIKLNVTPDAQVNIIPYENTGDIITTGEGKITLDLNREGSFSMLGTYTIDDGSYEFNLMNIINKNFRIQQGSRIDWYGDPADASVNIYAYYFIENVSLRDLNINEYETKKTDVSCFIEITGTLLAPELKLYITLPDNTDDVYLQAIKAFAEKEMNEQFLSLLLIESFMPISGEKDVSTDATKFLQNALNNVLKRTGQDISIVFDNSNIDNESDQVKVQYKRKILRGRVELKGNFGYEGNQFGGSQNEKYVGEFEIEGKLNEKGTIRIKGYNKANNKNESEGEYIQGIGVVWRGKFNSLFIRNKEKNNTVVKDSVKIFKYNPEKNN